MSSTCKHVGLNASGTSKGEQSRSIQELWVPRSGVRSQAACDGKGQKSCNHSESK